MLVGGLLSILTCSNATLATRTPSVLTVRGGLHSVCTLGDIDGDGCADVLVGVRSGGPGGFFMGCVCAYSGKTGRRLYRVVGDEVRQGLGTSVCALADIDGDGVRDFAVGGPGVGPDEERGYRYGSVWICSGRDGRVLRRLRGWEQGDEFGRIVRVAGDIDRDGVEDLIIGAPGADDCRGRALVISGRTGEMLLDLEAQRADGWFGMAVDAAGDVDGDGVLDLVVGAPCGSPGIATVFSGKSGCPIQSLTCRETNPHDWQQFGCEVRRFGDVDGDGVPDILIGADAGGESEEGQLNICSGRTGAWIASLIDDTPHCHIWSSFSSCIELLPDIDGDGVPEIIVGDPADDFDDDMSRSQAPGSALVFSGATHQRIHVVYGDSQFMRLGYAVGDAGDVDGDGVADFIVEAGGQPYDESSAFFRIYSGADAHILHELHPLALSETRVPVPDEKRR